MNRRLIATAGAVAATLLLAACGGSPADPTQSDDSQSTASGTDSSLETVTPGKLTIATGEPAYSPWVEDNDPTSGKGLEAAVAMAVASEMGYSAEDVVWIRTPFDTAIAPGPKDFDMNIQQFSITPEREEAVDFSTPYYTSSQAVLSIKGNKGADAKDIAGLADASIGVAAGSSSIKVAQDVIAPKKEVQIFNSNDDAVAALQAGQIDAIVTDFGTVLYLASSVLEDGVIVGQLDSTEGADDLAFLLPKDSPLTSHVSAAVDTLRDSGELDKIATTWITEGAGIPSLK
jgi:ABC-type amino acid transport/signal transduction systems, periplasmic component/domain